MKWLVKAVYNRVIRPYTPRRTAEFGGVPVRDIRLLDSTDSFPDYEAALLEAIRANVHTGDHVVIVGAGRGVSGVIAAQQTGPQGSVTAFEASTARYDLAIETAEINDVEETVSVEHAVVGHPIEVHDHPGGAESIAPAELPACDVLILDCEGAEESILGSLQIAPRVLVVETHGFLGVPENSVRELVDDLGYSVVDRGVENAELGVFVLTALRD